MRRTISYKGKKHVYDTDKAEEIGEPLYFRYGIGGPKSEYGTEGSIFTMSNKEAKAW